MDRDNKQLELLFDQQLFLINEELQNLREEKSRLMRLLNEMIQATDDVYEPIISSYRNAMTGLYLKELERKRMEKTYDSENLLHQNKLTALKKRTADLKSDVFDGWHSELSER